MGRIAQFKALAPAIIDLSADFRLRDAADYPTWYGHPHESPDMLKQFVYGIPELHREEMKRSKLCHRRRLSGHGEHPRPVSAVQEGYWSSQPSFIEGKVGSSAAGNEPGLSSHHPERAGAVRSFQPTGHRHTGEIIQELTFGGVAADCALLGDLGRAGARHPGDGARAR